MNEIIERALKVSIKNQHKIKSALKPLTELFGINYFYYSRVTENGLYSSFSTNPDWNRWCFEKNLHHETFYFLQPSHYRMGMTISIPCLEEQFKNVQLLASQKFNIHYILEVVSKNQCGIESYGFSSHQQDYSTITCLLTDLPCLKLFFKQFRERHVEIFDQLDEYQINLAKEIGPKFFLSAPSIQKSTIQCNFLHKIGIPILAELSQRERETCGMITRGLSAGEIAEDLELSKRTIESYIENIKIKLNCFTKAEMVQKCLDLESIGYFNVA